MQNDPQLKFEKRTQPNEIAAAAAAAYTIMQQAVRNANAGLLPKLEELNKPANPVRYVDPNQAIYPNPIDLAAYRYSQAREVAQAVLKAPAETPAKVASQPTDNLDALRKTIEAIHASEQEHPNAA